MPESVPKNALSSPSLDALQRWFQAATTHPGGITAGAQSAPAVDAIPATTVDEIVCRSSRQSAEERVAVYAQAYWARLLECLREEFPVLRATVGEEAFDGLAVGYLIAHPSTSYTLGRLSETFPEYLRSTIAADSGVDPFSELVVDLARLERAANDVFDASGGETLGFLTVQQLDRVAPEQRGALNLALLPTVRLLSFHTNVNDFFTAMRTSAESAPTPEICRTFVALTRRDYIVRRLSLTEMQYELLTAIATGQSLSDALRIVCERQTSSQIETIAAAEPVDSETLRTWFADWARVGIFAALEP
ncbi:MAG: hypothetical protein C0483_05865 [Pirellula sp.]|nr:hypothetical protein [Pirellula sp.]